MKELRNLKDFQSWEKAQLKTLRAKNINIYMIVQYNQCYGEIITAFQIGETPQTTGVGNRFFSHPCEFKEQDSLLGEREFENGSITWEFLWKPLELPLPENHQSPIAFTDFYSFKRALENKLS